MVDSGLNLAPVAHSARRLARRFLAIWHNRLELLLVELHQEREKVVNALLMALGVAVLGLLAAMALTAAIVVLFWNQHPAVVLLVIGVLYGAGAGFLVWKLKRSMHDWQTLASTLDQLRKDRDFLVEPYQALEREEKNSSVPKAPGAR